MTWIRLTAAFAFAASTAAAPAGYTRTDIRWTSQPTDDATHVQLSLSDEADRNNNSTSYRYRDLVGLDRVQEGRSGAPLSFTLAREAGTLRCAGTAQAARRGSGTCRFEGNPAFAQALARRGIRLSSPDRLLSLALLSVRLAAIDDLAAAGLPPRSERDVVEAAALDVTGEYVRMLGRARLRPATMHEAVTCRAVGVDAPFVQGLAANGYRNLTVSQVVRLRALNVTPRYAAAMNRAAGRGQ